MPHLAILGLSLTALFSLGGLCVPPGGPPRPDACDSPDAQAVSSIEIGAGDESVFSPLANDTSIVPTIGPQGGAMIPIRLRVTGSPPPSCLAVIVRVTDETGFDIAGSGTPLGTYPDDGGARTTHTLWLPGAYSSGQRVTVSAASGGRTAARTILIGR